MLSLTVCSQNEITKPYELKKPNTKLLNYIQKNSNDSLASESIGSVSNGSLKNGKLVPFYGSNFTYFDLASYLSGRAFLNSKVLKAILEGYKTLETEQPNRKFKIMECAHKKGGKLWPHHTHQNGLSVDFMMPKTKNKKPCYDLDTLGIRHYWLIFNNSGQYLKDNSISIDFESVAQHILILNKKAKKNKLKIEKVIIKVEFKEKLFEGKQGRKLKESGIYIVKSLTSKMNELHDDHYHIDFKEI
ncbi:MAG: replication initiation protein [Flavobacteriales bacterium]|nr:replication initiation protein [Flavobacteriales bacterium]|tara:strand:- start:25 stop:759 length:735 start_codon:yes stop_codon:yes gene_type:complete